jgi:hypothetical protein
MYYSIGLGPIGAADLCIQTKQRKSIAGDKRYLMQFNNILSTVSFPPIPNLRKPHVGFVISLINKQPSLSKLLINISFPYSCIHFKYKPFKSAQCYRCEFYLEIYRCHIHCSCSSLRVRNVQKKP